MQGTHAPHMALSKLSVAAQYAIEMLHWTHFCKWHPSLLCTPRRTNRRSNKCPRRILRC